MLLGASCPRVTLRSPVLTCKRWGQVRQSKEDKERTEPRPGVLRCHQLEERRYAHGSSELYPEAQKLHAWKFITISLVHKSNTIQACDSKECMGYLVKTLIQTLLFKTRQLPDLTLALWSLPALLLSSVSVVTSGHSYACYTAINGILAFLTLCEPLTLILKQLTRVNKSSSVIPRHDCNVNLC